LISKFIEAKKEYDEIFLPEINLKLAEKLK
jgi:hypothetical protein